MRFSKLIVAALSAPLCIDGNPKDDAAEETDVASFGGMHFGDEEKNHLSMDDAMMALRSFRNDKAGLAPIDLDAWTQATELRNPENAIDHASRDENEDIDDDFAVDIGVLSMESQPSTECASYPVLNQTGELNASAFYDLAYYCYSGSPYLEDCPYEYSVGLHCWNTSFITDLSYLFGYLYYFNDDISSWDTGKVTDLSFTFREASSFNVDISSWDIGKVTDLSYTFLDASSFNVNISAWDTGKVTTLRGTFADASSFNSDISSWDIGKVTSLFSTFRTASSFNSDISSWDTGNVTTLKGTFLGAYRFNSNISSWNTGSVTTLYGTFAFASSFNSDVSSWDTGNVTSLFGTLYDASSFNSDISSWDIGKAKGMMLTFRGASSFNVDISAWGTGNVVSLAGTFFGASSFNVDISSWDTSNVLTMDYMFFGATEFNQCLGRWAAKTPDTVSTSSMLNNTACPNQSDPEPEKGPWCQGVEERCFAACSDAEEFRFGKNDRKSCNSINDITAPTEKKLKKKIRRFCKRKAFRHEEEEEEATTGKTIRVKDVCQESCGSRGFGPGKIC